MLLKELTSRAQAIESTDVFKGIEMVIPPNVIEEIIGQTNSVEERKRRLPLGCRFSNCHEYMGI